MSRHVVWTCLKFQAIASAIPGRTQSPLVIQTRLRCRLVAIWKLTVAWILRPWTCAVKQLDLELSFQKIIIAAKESALMECTNAAGKSHWRRQTIRMAQIRVQGQPLNLFISSWIPCSITTLVLHRYYTSFANAKYILRRRHACCL